MKPTQDLRRLDNVTFLDRTHVAFVEDAGDTVHTQRGAGLRVRLRHDHRLLARRTAGALPGRGPTLARLAIRVHRRRTQTGRRETRESVYAATSLDKRSG
ncbi:hypothetical protein LJ657_41600 [Streptomyces sp. NR30]|uniref:Uncharacterized protein n=1 Tax=Streptomyces guryensis TaxID=2886947 RepID=A0A9Q3VZ46_9ACTN|nr:hypothetical protein [Streptomyces guryensis]